jgi:peptidyl-prolyl cis-trans isomerase D
MFLNAAGMFDLAKFKEYFKSNPAQAQFLRKRKMQLSCCIKFIILLKSGFILPKRRKVKI